MRPRWHAIGILTVLLGIGNSCQDVTPSPTQPHIDRPTGDVSNYSGPIRQGEVAFAELATKVPTSAGFYIDQAHSLVVIVRDSTDADRAIAALQSMIAAGQFLSSHRMVRNVRAQRGEYTFAQLATWRDMLSDSALGYVGGVTAVDLNEQTNRVVVGLDPSAATLSQEWVSQLLRRLGIDSGAVSFRTIRIMASNGDSITSEDDSLVGGIYFSPSPYDGCTLGFVADIGSQRAFVTASHCTPNVFQLDLGSPAYQKHLNENLVGAEYIDPSGSWCGTLHCRRADAAAYEVSTYPTARGLIARTAYRGSTGNGSFAVDPSHPYFIIDAVEQQIVGGDEINKMGVGAGWTWGAVTSTCMDISVTGAITYIVKCAYEGDYISRLGDSGGPMFTWDGGDAVTLLGLNFATNADHTLGYFSAYGDIASVLGSMTAVRGINLSTPLLSGQVSEGLAALSWSAVSGATRYDIFRETNDNRTGTTTGLVFIGSTPSSPYRDVIAVTQYDGTTNPGPRVPGYLRYHIYAASNTDISANSRDIYFTTP